LFTDANNTFLHAFLTLTVYCSNLPERRESQYNLAERSHKQESRAVARKPRDATAVLFGLKFAGDIHYKFKSSQASKARLQTGIKQNLTQKGDSRSFKVTYFVHGFSADSKYSADHYLQLRFPHALLRWSHGSGVGHTSNKQTTVNK